MTGADIITAIRSATLLDTSAVSDAQFVVWINEGYYRIASLERWPWLQGYTSLTLSPGSPSTAFTSIDSSLRRITGVWDVGQGQRLSMSSLAGELQQYGPYPVTDIASTITEPIAATDATEMTVASASLLTNLAGHSASTSTPIYVRFTLDGEIVRITSFASNVATIERGQYGTTPATHLDNAVIKYAPMAHAGRPRRFFTVGSSLYLAPVPDDDYTLIVLYDKAPTAITTANSPEFDTLFHMALAHYGEFRAWQREEDLDKANTAYGHYMSMVRDMRGWYAQLSEHQPWTIGQSSQPALTNTPFLDGL